MQCDFFEMNLIFADLEHDGQTTLRILDGTAWCFNQANCWKWWRTVMCGGSILSCCPRTLTDMSGLC